MTYTPSSRRHFLKTLSAVGGITLLQPYRSLEQSAMKAEAKTDGEKAKEGLPLKPERRIEFTTDEGTWISLDISRDGKTILFELLGDLYTVPLEGGDAVGITSGMAFDSQPRYSPDGSHLAFVSDRDGAENVWIANSDGSNPKQLSEEEQCLFVSPSWTPDGKYVFVTRMAPGSGIWDLSEEIWMYHSKGGKGIQVTRSKPKPDTPFLEWHNAMGPVASPDGRYLYYAKRTGRQFLDMVSFDFPLSQIARRDLTTGDEEVITEAPGSAMRPMVSPDGTKLVYGTRHQAETGLRLRDLSTGEERWLKYPVQRDAKESFGERDLLPGYAFTPDGREIVVSYGGRIHRVNVESGEARVVPFTANVSREVGPLLNFPSRIDEGPVRARLIQAPSQSPDGKRLAFSALTHLYTMSIPDGRPTRVTSGDSRGEFHPAWSPDGKWLAYVTWSTEGGHIWKIRVDRRGTPQQLTLVPGYYRNPAWSPDGQRLVALYRPSDSRGADDDLVWIPAEGGDLKRILPARGAGGPHFGNEKDRVYVYSGQGLISLRFDGTDRRTHLKIVGAGRGAEPMPAQDARISPDGRYALALVNNQLYLVAVPRIGGDPPTVNVGSPSVPLRKLTEVGADYLAWADGGSALTWGLGSSFFRLPLADVTFEPTKESERKPPVEEIEAVVERPRHIAKGVIALRGARAITMRGEEVIPDAVIVITDNRITALGRRGSVTVPERAQLFDVDGMTIMPGIVDVHAHWGIRRSVLDIEGWYFLANLAYGVTTGRDAQVNKDIFAYQDLGEIGEMLGPRVYSTGPGIFHDTKLQSAEDARNVVAKYKKYYRTKTLKHYLMGNRKQRQWLVEACKEHRIMPTTEGASNLKLGLTFVIDGFSGLEHYWGIFPLYEDVVELVARAGAFYTPTLMQLYGGPPGRDYFFLSTDVHDDPKLQRFIPPDLLESWTRRRQWFREDEHVYWRAAASAAKIVRAGGRVCIGGHGGVQGMQCHWDLWALQSGGLTNFEALRAATLHGAEAIGYAQDLGSIEVGKLADLIMLAENPLEDIRNTNTIKYVMKNGELFEGDTLNQIWPQQKTPPRMWWWDDQP
jgi:Tol biopolymer transport system component